MTIKKVTINPGCITCGTCEFIAPAIFAVTDVARVKENAPVCAFSADIQQAAQACPVNVISYERE